MKKILENKVISPKGVSKGVKLPLGSLTPKSAVEGTENAALADGTSFTVPRRVQRYGTDIVRLIIAARACVSSEETRPVDSGILKPAEGVEPSEHEMTISIPYRTAGYLKPYHGVFIILLLLLAYQGSTLMGTPLAQASVTVGKANTASLTNGLVGYWPLDGSTLSWTTGKAFDLSGQGNTGNLISMSTTTSPVIGKIGQALKLDGLSSQITFPSITTGTTFTYSAWINPSIDSGTNGYGSLFSTSAGDSGIYFMNSGGNTQYINFYYSGNHFNSTALTLGKWQQIVVSVNAGNVTFYLNGVANGTATGATSFSAARMGKDTGSQIFKGSLDDVRIYNRALSAQEVSQLYALGQTKVGTAPVVAPATNLLSGLVGYWPLEEGSGVTTKDVIGGNTGTLISSPTWVKGKYGNALSFNGSTNYVSIPSASSVDFGASQDFTISAWVKSTQAAVNTKYPSILGKDNNSGSFRAAYGITLHNSNIDSRWFLSIFSANVNYTAYGRSNIADGTWHHVVGVRSGSTLLTYEDGTLANTSAASSGSLSNTANLLIGSYSTTGSGPILNGSVDDVRIYNRALSAAEVKQLYSDEGLNVAHSNTTTLATGLVGYWPFDGSNINWKTGIASDVSGSGNNGSLISMSTTTSPVIGKIGQALNFNGSPSKISLPDAAFPATPATFTLSAWFKTSTVGPAGALINRYAVTNGGGYRMMIYNNQLYCTTDNGAFNNLISTINVNDGKWHVATCAYDGTTKKLYIDGALNNSSAASAPTSGGNGLANIGYDQQNNAYFKGSIDDVRVYNRALSAQEVSQLYLAGK